jgi:glycosyltransferase involved in cell wall biosynthesis
MAEEKEKGEANKTVEADASQKTEAPRKKKLLIATDNFLPRWDGIARFLSVIIPKMKEEYDITVVAPSYGPYIPNGFKLVQVPLGKRGLGDYTAAKFSLKTVRKAVRDADVVFSQTTGPIGFLTVFHAKRYRKPVASFIHNIEWELVPKATKNLLVTRILMPVVKQYSRYIYRKSDLLIVPAESIAEMLTWKRINTKKTIVHLGVDSEVFRPLAEKSVQEQDRTAKIKEALGLRDEFVVGYHGRIAYEKDLFTLSRAYNWLRKSHKNVRLLIVGDGVPEIKEKLKAMEGVILVGAKSNVQDYLPLMSAYVTSSLTETTSLTTLEAMATGLPVICTPVGFIKEYVSNNYNGMLFPKGDAFALYKDLETIKGNPALAQLFGERARKTVLKDFQWSHTVEEIERVLGTMEK